jgi:predicted amidohydrolase YtcJ
VEARTAQSIDDIVSALKQRAETLPEGKWLKGTGYNDRRLRDGRHPTRWDLDKASEKHPIYLQRTDAHLGVANSVALKLAGVTKDTPDPDGGRIDRDEAGDPNGLLREQAQAAVRTLIPQYTIAEVKEGLLAACDRLASWGFTSFSDAGVSHDAMVAYQELVDENKLPLRAGLMVRALATSGQPGYLQDLKTVGIHAGFGNERLRILGTKFICDGSMSGWTAAMYEPYANEPSERGIIVMDPEELTEGMVESHKAGLRPLVHAIGDRAIDITLDAMEKALKERADPDHRMRIEHCSIPTDKAIDRIKRLGVMPSSSVGFIYELGPAHLLGMGPERIKNYFPHKTWIDKGVISVGNSDWGVTAANIAKQLYAVVTRKGYNGEVIGGSQAVSVIEAIRLYTMNAAYGSFEENIKGSIELGKLADITVLDRDILAIPTDELIDMQIEMTIVGGAVVYQRKT